MQPGRVLSIYLKKTKNRFLAVLVGFLITTLIQSSSATTVMVVGFVNTGLMNLTQAIGVIMGANIGTTTTKRSCFAESYRDSSDSYIYRRIYDSFCQKEFAEICRAGTRRFRHAVYGYGAYAKRHGSA